MKKLLCIGLVLLLLLTGCGLTDPAATLPSPFVPTAPSSPTSPTTLTDPALPGEELTVHFIDVGQADCALLEANGVDIAFAPRVVDIYPEPDTRVFNLGGLDSYGEGPRRPGHFNGVAQVVTRLFDIVKPQFAFFGEKDFQQVAIIKYFVKDLNYPLEIVQCPILREDDGLAKSSRNTLLTPAQREAAPHIYKCLQKAAEYAATMTPAQAIETLTKEIDSNPELETEYIEFIDANMLKPVTSWDDAAEVQLWCAVYARPVRLIDNIKIK